MLGSKAIMLGYVHGSLAPNNFLFGYYYGFLLLTQCYCSQSKEEKYFIHNHLAFTVKYHRDTQTETARIVGFEVKPFRSVFQLFLFR